MPASANMAATISALAAPLGDAWQLVGDVWHVGDVRPPAGDIGRDGRSDVRAAGDRGRDGRSVGIGSASGGTTWCERTKLGCKVCPCACHAPGELGILTEDPASKRPRVQWHNLPYASLPVLPQFVHWCSSSSHAPGCNMRSAKPCRCTLVRYGDCVKAES